ncbi:MAG: LLM class flavin-dependent oxidoreductase [Chloroflexi bacterium]|nr:LLM class flavin-dependent oxidoreductase [Chloroflexota bacterium]
MPSAVNVGLLVPSNFVGRTPDRREFVDFFRAAEVLGFHSLWAVERVIHERAAAFHPFSFLAWAAGATSRIKLGTAVVLATLRHPLLIAKAAGTLDYLSGGRFVLGVSVGGRPEEFEALGIPIRQRARRLEETMALLRQMWSGPQVSFQGRYFSFQGPSLAPRPARPDAIPILVGGTAEPVLKRAATLGDGWIAGSGAMPEYVKEGWLKVQHWATEAGRDPGKLDLGKLLYVAVDDTVAKARRRLAPYVQGYYGEQYDVDGRCAFGPPEACAQKLLPFVAAGVKTFILGLSWPSVRELERLQRDVVPLLR